MNHRSGACVACHDATVVNQLAVPGWARQVRPARTAADQSGSKETNTGCRRPQALVIVDLCHLLMAKATWPPVWHQWTLGTKAHSCSVIHEVSEAPELNATKHPPCIISLSVPLQKRRPDWINSGSMQGNCFLNLWRHPQWTFKGGFIIYKHYGALYPSSNYQTKSFTKFHYTYILLVYPYLGINPLPELMNASWSEYIIGEKNKI